MINEEILTSTQAAEILGVAPASIKRWADAGLLPCIRTAGGHRRFRRDDIEKFQQNSTPTPAEQTQREPWVDHLLGTTSIHMIMGEILHERAKFGSWWKVAKRFSVVLQCIGQLWSSGSLSILEEHLITERLARVLARCSESLPPRRNAPQCLLASAQGDDHTLGLSLIELCFREAGFVTLWAGRKTPTSELIDWLSQKPVEVVALSASSISEEETLRHQASCLGNACKDSGIKLLFGGSGRWPDPPAYGERLHSLQDLHSWLSSYSSQSKIR